MTTKSNFLIFLLSTYVFINSFAQVPLVYSEENTGKDCPRPVLPSMNELPVIDMLPDPFAWSDGSGRSTNFSDWKCRRSEIKAEIENYEIGPKPDRPDNITASYSGGTLTVNVTVNGRTLTLTSQVVLPSGSGPFPAVIGMGGATGSLPSSIFSSRNIAQITFNYAQVMAHSQNRGSEPINALYPDLIYMGAYSAWPWGVSRIIDGLELVSSNLPIDLKHIAVTGCSFAGKMALFSGAFDERVALTIAQEPGGGGAAAWRVSKTLGDVETLCATNHGWFMEEMFQFCGNESKLPHDHHELMAMVAPRALLVLGNPDYGWLAEESGYVSCRAAQEVWKSFGISDRFGFSIVGGHSHCALPGSQYPEVEAFVDKFLLGNTNANTNVTVNPYPSVDYNRWYAWWGSEDPGTPDDGDAEKIWLEAECGTVGANWNTISDGGASNGSYVTVKSGLNSTASAPTGSNDAVVLPFQVQTTGNFNIMARVNCPSGDDDSFWVKVDNGSFTDVNNIGTSGWAWKQLVGANLTAGSHTLTIAYREDGALLDKIEITTSGYLPSGEGETAGNCSISSDDYNISVRALGAEGTEQITLAVGGTALQTWTLGTSMADYTATTSLAGNITVEFTNDEGSRDVQVDYIKVNNTTYQAEDQATNTGVWQDESCGGQYSEWLHCNGYIEFNAFKSVTSANATIGESIMLYPNPVNDILNVTLPAIAGESALLAIYSSNGSLIKKAFIKKGENTIGLSMINPGLYIVKIQYKNGLITRKFLKK